MLPFIDRTTEYETAVLLTRIYTHNSEIVADVARNMGQRVCGEHLPNRLKVRIKELKKMLIEPLEQFNGICLYTLTYHQLIHMA